MNLMRAGVGLARATPRLWRGVDGRQRLNRVLRLVPRVLELAATEMGTPDPVTLSLIHI